MHTVIGCDEANLISNNTIVTNFFFSIHLYNLTFDYFGESVVAYYSLCNIDTLKHSTFFVLSLEILFQNFTRGKHRYRERVDEPLNYIAIYFFLSSLVHLFACMLCFFIFWVRCSTAFQSTCRTIDNTILPQYNVFSFSFMNLYQATSIIHLPTILSAGFAIQKEKEWKRIYVARIICCFG